MSRQRQVEGDQLGTPLDAQRSWHRLGPGTAVTQSLFGRCDGAGHTRRHPAQRNLSDPLPIVEHAVARH